MANGSLFTSSAVVLRPNSCEWPARLAARHAAARDGPAEHSAIVIGFYYEAAFCRYFDLDAFDVSFMGHSFRRTSNHLPDVNDLGIAGTNAYAVSDDEVSRCLDH
ncbi:hypothetical protein [Rhodoplanes sp. Z2-YC6860]|uniref:hypothetical protein n=1 Tax=Rhodoplanes sp. Z2-YC6860 TaxID=674703 RepID=UPI0012ED02DF|nr:hypothetical protein [Rhodoplanes sp. Z2-YC6860]